MRHLIRPGALRRICRDFVLAAWRIPSGYMIHGIARTATSAKISDRNGVWRRELRADRATGLRRVQSYFSRLERGLARFMASLWPARRVNAASLRLTRRVTIQPAQSKCSRGSVCKFPKPCYRSIFGPGRLEPLSRTQR